MEIRNMTGAAAGSWARRSARTALAGLLAVGVAACDLDTVLEVTDPDAVTPELTRDPANLPGLRAGALGDFAVAYAGLPTNTEGLILSSGLLADEFYVGDTFGTRQEVDRRSITVNNSGMLTVFRNMHRARRAAEVASERYAAGLPNTAAHAEVTSLAGFMYVFFAENYCSGVPFSRLTEDSQLEHGQPQTTTQMFESALAYFDNALTVATAAGNAAQQNLARVGRGRALLGLNRPVDAAAAVAAVPTTFAYEILHSANSTRQNNGVWMITHNRRGYSVAHREGGNGLPFRMGNSQSGATQDPRVRYTRTAARATDSPFAHFFQQRYPTLDSNIPLATGTEARLMEAEAALRQGAAGVPTFVARHNELRARVAGLAPIAVEDVAAMTQVQRENLHFQERGFWLFLTANRLSDMRRLVRQYNRPAETVFPTGAWGRPVYAGVAVPDAALEFRSQGTYGPDVNFPVPDDELNNPNFQQCINRGA
jgi:starch-binding outer membrane protein, SusD/RagB family